MRLRHRCLFILLPCFLVAGLGAAESLSDLRARAERGDAAARYDFARRVFEQGEGKNADREVAVPWLEAAVDQGHAPSLELAATLRLIEESDYADFARGVDLVRRAELANPASPRVKALRGLMHHQGRGRDYNPELGLTLIAEAVATGDLVAKELQRLAQSGKSLADALAYDSPPPPLLREAENGDAEAQLKIAQLYLRCHILHREKRNPGLDWRERAAESGSAAAQTAVGEALRSGTGYPKDPVRALRWLMRAAAQKHPRAAYVAGLMHRDGEGTTKNEAEAVRLLELAIEQGSQDAETPLGIMLVEGRGTAADPQRGFELLSKAEKRNNTTARAFLLEQGLANKYVVQDSSQLIRLLEHGVRLKNTRAKAILGIRLLSGDKVKQDLGRASVLLREASEEGSLEATTAYLNFLSTEIDQLEERKKKSGTLFDSIIAEKIRDYRDALVLYGRNGGPEQRLEAAKVLSYNWISPTSEAFRERHGTSLDPLLQKTVALVRIYRSERGKDPAALSWLGQIEIHYRDMKWENANRQTAQMLFERAEKELRNFKQR